MKIRLPRSVGDSRSGKETVTFHPVLMRSMSHDPRRRRALQAIGAGMGAMVAGCLGGDDTGDDEEADDGNDAPRLIPVEVSSEDTDMAGNSHSVRLRYATDTVARLPPDMVDSGAAPGNKFVILSAEVSVSSVRSDPITVFASSFGLEFGGSRYEATSFPNLPGLSSHVNPPTTYEAWAKFEIPEEAEEATLIAIDPGLFFDLPTDVLFEIDEHRSASL